VIVVILFAVTKEAEKVLKAAENSTEARDKFTWIASDGWTSLIPNKKSDTSYISQLKRKKLSFLNRQALCNAYKNNNKTTLLLHHSAKVVLCQNGFLTKLSILLTNASAYTKKLHKISCVCVLKLKTLGDIVCYPHVF